MVVKRYRPRTTESPSLRGSGLKSSIPLHPQINVTVSLFTREWIEIPHSCDGVLKASNVSLFTREWIEMIHCKSVNIFCCGLPLYEGVD